jgi:hypothetical protein
MEAVLSVPLVRERKEIIMHAFFKQNFISNHRDLQRGFAQQLTTEPASGNEAIYLKKHQHLRMHDACGWTVHAVAGTVWITQDGDVRDIVLEAGQSFVLDRKHPAILSPLNEAQIVLERGSCRQAAQNRTRQSAPSRALSA